MKLRAIRLSAVGRFSEPVALEGLSGGLDLLVGANEAGKSTIFRAIEAVFLRKHTLTGRVLEALRPATGGEPLIEADFETEGRRWRLTKQFGRAKRASLMDLDTGKLVARSGEAEEQLAQLLAIREGESGRLGLLWVGQRMSLYRPDPDFDPVEGKARPRGESQALMTAIEGEVETVAQGMRMRQARARVGAALGQEVQAKRKAPRRGSRYDIAVTRRDALHKLLAEARMDADKAAANLEEIDRRRVRRAEIAAPEVIAAMQASIASLEAEWDTGNRALQRYQAALTTQAEKERTRETALRAWAVFDESLKDCAEIVRQLSQDESALVTLRTEATDAARACELHKSALAEVSAQEARLCEQRIAREHFERRRETAQRLEERSRALAVARRLEAEIATATAGLDGRAPDKAAMDRLEKLEQAAALIEAQISAAAARVRIDYREGAAGRIRIAGKPVEASRELVLDGPLTLDIDGIGSITVLQGAGLQGAGASQTDKRDELARVRTQLAAAYEAAGVASLDDARKLHAQRLAAEQAIHHARAQLVTIAPHGATALAAEVETLAQYLGENPSEEQEPPPRDVISKSLEHARSRLDEVRGAAETAQSRFAALQRRIASLEGAAEGRRQRLNALERALPEQALRADERARLAAVTEAATRAANEALRMSAALADAAPPQHRLDELKRRADAARDALRRAEHEAGEIDIHVARLTGELTAMDESGLGVRVAALEGELERAEAEVRRIEREIAALTMLDDALAEAEAETRDRFLRPVAERLAPYLDLVLPGARLSFTEGFAVTGLERDGRAEALAGLSEGTQEQIAVLVRLGFARLLAETGHPAPLILDDALVYSDDARIERMFGALREAARRHQVLIFTCRARAFEHLDAVRTSLVPWRDE